MLVLHALMQASFLWAPGLGQSQKYSIESLPPVKPGSSLVKFVGDTVELSCLLKNEQKDRAVPDKWQWKRLSGGSLASLNLEDMSSITLSKVDHSFSDTYICTADIDGQIFEQSIKLLIIDTIGWTDPSESVGGQVGESVTIDCSLAGNGNTIVKIVDDSTNLLFKNNRYHLAGDDKLTIDPLRKKDNGRVVKCDAARTIRDTAYLATHAISKTVKVTVYHKPEFDESMTKFYGIPGKNGSLSCTVLDSNPPVVQFEFFRGDEPLGSNGDLNYVIDEQIDQQKAVLNIKTLSGFHFDDDYTCRAKNGQAQAKLSLTLSEGNPPGPVQATLTSTSKHSVEWQLQTSGESSELPVTQFRVQYVREDLLKSANLLSPSKLSVPGILNDNFWKENSSIIHVKNEGAGTVFVAKGLRKNTFYNFRFSAVNAAGWGEKQELRAETKEDDTVTPAASKGADKITPWLAYYLALLFATLFLRYKP